MVTQTSSSIQIIKLRRQKANSSFGFSLRGGCEHGTGFYISDVEFGSEAEQKGLKVGDQLLRVNGFTLDKAIHQEVLSVIKCKNRLVLKVKHVGMVPVKNNKKDPLTWRVTDTSADYVAPQIYNLRREEVIETEIFIEGADGPAGLGCSIANGPQEKPGIYVQTTKVGGLAHEAGLRTGDQIIKINGSTLEGVNFSEAVATFKSASSLSLVILKSVGLDLFVPGLRQSNLELPIHNAFDVHDSSKHFERLTPQSHSSDTSSHNSMTDHLATSSSAGTTSSLSDDPPCSSSDDAGSLTSSETYGWNGSDSVSSISSFRKEQERLAEERRQLELDQLKLQQESEELLKEKEKLQQEKKKQEALNNKPDYEILPPPQMPFVMPTIQKGSNVNFLKELKEKSTAREQRSLDVSSNEGSRIGSPRELTRKRNSCTDSENENFTEESHKRVQHEKLMREFRAAHKRMFAKPNSDSEGSIAEEVTNISDKLDAVKVTNVVSEAKETFVIEHVNNSRKSQVNVPVVANKPVANSIGELHQKLQKLNSADKTNRRNVKCPAPPPPPKSPENILTSQEKKVTILAEATDIVTSANCNNSINKLPNKNCNGILKKTGNLKTTDPKKPVIPKITSFADEKEINITPKLKNGLTNLHLPPKNGVEAHKNPTVRVTISSYPDATIQSNRFAPNLNGNLRKNLTTRVTLNGCN